MSVILVGTFLCLHFFETNVEKEYNAYNSVLSEIIEGKKMEIDYFLSSANFFIEPNAREREEMNLLEDDLQELENILTPGQSIKLVSSKKLLKKYGIDEDNLKIYGGISAYSQYLVIDAIYHRMQSLNTIVEARDKANRESNIRPIIMNRQKSYTPNQTYDLELEIVDLYKFFPKQNLMVEIDGIEKEVVDFPLELDFKPKSIAFRAVIENRVTGEKQKINEIYRP